MKTLKEMYEWAAKDKDTQECLKKNGKRYEDAIDKLTSSIVSPCLDYATEQGEDDDGWAYTILVSLARATCYIIDGLQHSAYKETGDIYQRYCEEILPLCREIASQELGERAELLRMAADDKKEDEDAQYAKRREIIRAIANPEMSADDIIETFFGKGLPDGQIQVIKDIIFKMRTEKAEELKKVHMMQTKGN